MRVGTFTVPAVVRNPRHPERSVALDLLVPFQLFGTNRGTETVVTKELIRRKGTRREKVGTALVETGAGATWTLLPADIVTQLDLPTPWRRSVTLASGDLVTYATGEVALR